jgi:tetratricopeptide (TPR) repeat protein
MAVRLPTGRRWIQGAAVFVMATMMTVAPVTLRNYLKSGEIALVSCNMGINLYAGNNGNSDGYTPGGPLLGFWDCFSYSTLCARIGHITGENVNYTGADRYYTQKALEYMAANPGRILGLLWKKTLLFWGPLEVGNEEEEELERANSSVLRMIPGEFSVVMGFFVTGILMFGLGVRRGGLNCSADQKRLGTLALLLGAFYFLSFLPFIVAARYRTPLIPLMILFATATVGFLIDLFRQKRWQSAAAWLATAVVLTATFSWNAAGYVPNEANWHIQRANIYGKLNQYDHAADECRSALAFHPNHPVAFKALGNANLSKGDFASAIEAYREACRLDQLDSESRNNLAFLLMAQPETLPQAASLAEEACAITGYTDANAMDTLADCYIRLGRIEDGLQMLEKALRLARSQGDVNLAATLEQKLQREKTTSR